MKNIFKLFIIVAILLNPNFMTAVSYEIAIKDGVPYKLYPETGKATAYDGFGWELKSMPKHIKIADNISNLSPFFVWTDDSIHEKWVNKTFTVDTLDMRMCAFVGSGGDYENNVKSISIPSSIKVIKQLSSFYTKVDTIKISSLEQWLKLDVAATDRMHEHTILCVNNDPIRDLITPTGIKVIKKFALPGIKLNSLTLSEGVEKIESKAVYMGKIDSITLPESLKEIESKGLWNPYIRSIRLKSKKLKVGYDFIYPYDAQHSLYTDLYVDDLASWCSVGGGMEHEHDCGMNPCKHYDFQTCGKLRLVGDSEDGVLYVPEGVTHVRTEGLHVNHDKVKGIVLPSTLQEINPYAFCSVRKDKKQILQLKTAIPPQINAYSSLSEDSIKNRTALFYSYSHTIAYVPKGSGDAYRNAYGWSICEIIEGEPDWSSLDGVESNLSEDVYKITDNYISFSSEVKLIEVFDIKGNQLIKLSVKDSGVYSLESLGEGVYLVRINGKDAKKIMR